jgi:hypothetical protein
VAKEDIAVTFIVPRADPNVFTRFTSGEYADNPYACEQDYHPEDDQKDMTGRQKRKLVEVDKGVDDGRDVVPAERDYE